MLLLTDRVPEMVWTVSPQARMMRRRVCPGLALVSSQEEAPPIRLPRQLMQPQQQRPLEGREVNTGRHPPCLRPRGAGCECSGVIVQLWKGPRPQGRGLQGWRWGRTGEDSSQATQALMGMEEVQGSARPQGPCAPYPVACSFFPFNLLFLVPGRLPSPSSQVWLLFSAHTPVSLHLPL